MSEMIHRRTWLQHLLAMPGLLLSGGHFAHAAVPPKPPATPILLPVRLNGAGPYPFMVDSGANRSVISDTLAKLLNLRAAPDVRIEGVVNAVRVPAVHLPEIGFGIFRHQNLKLPVLPRSWLGADGFLGLDVFGKYLVTFDFVRHRLCVEKPPPAAAWLRYSARQEVIRADGHYGHLHAANCWVDGVPTTVFLDTGAAISVGNSSLLAALSQGGTHPDAIGTTDIYGVTGGVHHCQTMKFRKLKIQGLWVRNGIIGIADLHIFDVWGLKKKPALLLGMNFLHQFANVTIDYARKIFIFTLAAR